jgi:mannose-6-phosphate isomerase-like protein (cupin superfamily)
MIPQKINIAEKLSQIHDYWQPRIAGEVQGMHIKIVKIKGEFVWHHHEIEDELFLVIKGTLTMRFRDGDVKVSEGEFIIVPKGVEHCPAADDEVHVMLFEPAGTLNTGNIQSEHTVENPQRI